MSDVACPLLARPRTSSFYHQPLAWNLGMRPAPPPGLKMAPKPFQGTISAGLSACMMIGQTISRYKITGMSSAGPPKEYSERARLG